MQALRSTGEGREQTEQDWAVLDELVAVAGELSRSPAQVALNWVVDQPA